MNYYVDWILKTINLIQAKYLVNNKAIKVAYQERVDLRDIIIKVETKTATKQGLVVEIITLLVIISIAL